MDSEPTRAVSYDELARARAISLAAAKNLVRRKRWPRVKANDGLVRIQVPVAELRENGPHESPHEGHHGRPQEGPPGTLARLVELERHNARLEAATEAFKEALAKARTETDEALAKALAEALTTASLRATLEAVTGERDRLLTEKHLRESRSWWRRLVGE